MAAPAWIYISTFSIAVPLVVAVIYRAEKNKLSATPLLIFVAAGTQLADFVLMETGVEHLWLYHIYSLAELGLLSFILLEFSGRDVRIAIPITFVLLMLTLFTANINGFEKWGYLYQALIVFVLGFNVLKILVFHSSGSALANARFYVVFGTIGYYALTVSSYFSVNYLIEFSLLIFSAANVFQNLMIARGLWINYKTYQALTYLR